MRGAVGPVRIQRGEVGAPSSKLGKALPDFMSGRRLVARGLRGEWVPVDPLSIASPPMTYRRPQRFACQLVGIGLSGWTPFVSALTKYNGEKALTIRVLSKPKYSPAAGVFDDVRRFIDRLLPGWGHVEALTIQDWLDSMPARRKRPLAAAARKVSERYWQEKWGTFKAFVKTEMLPGNSKDEPHTPILSVSDRVIQGPADEAHVIMGPHLKPLTKRLKEIWHSRHNIFYASVDVPTLSRWYRQVFGPGVIGLAADYSGFDNSHSSDSWAFVEHLYARAKLGVGDRRVHRLLRAWRTPSGVMSGMGWALKYLADCMNASGRDDTALANAILNGFAMFLAVVAAMECVPLEHLTEAMLDRARDWLWVAVCGDDSLVAVQRPVGQGFRERVSFNISCFGFCAEAEKLVLSTDPFQHVFLGMRPYPTKDGWSFGKTIGRASWKRGWKMDDLDCHLPAWLRGVCQAELVWNAHVPFYADYLRRTLDLLGQGPTRRIEQDPNKPWTVGGSTDWYTEDAVRYVCRGYGLAASAHGCALAELQSVSRLPFVLDSAVFDRFVMLDDL